MAWRSAMIPALVLIASMALISDALPHHHSNLIGSSNVLPQHPSFLIYFDCVGCFLGATYDAKQQVVQADWAARYSSKSELYRFSNGSVVTANTLSPPDRNETTTCETGAFNNHKMAFSDLSRIDKLRANTYTWLPSANITGRFDVESCAVVTGIDKACKPEGPEASASCLLIPAAYLNPRPCSEAFCAVTSACFGKRPVGGSLDWSSLMALGFHNEDGQAYALTGAVFQPGASVGPDMCPPALH